MKILIGNLPKTSVNLHFRKTRTLRNRSLLGFAVSPIAENVHARRSLGLPQPPMGMEIHTRLQTRTRDHKYRPIAGKVRVQAVMPPTCVVLDSCVRGFRQLRQGLCTPNMGSLYPFIVTPIMLRLKFTFRQVNFFIFENFKKVMR